MRFHWLLTIALSVSSPLISTDAFTFGPFLPSYLCGPAVAQANGAIVGKPSAAAGFPAADFPNGPPKALAGVLAKFLEYTPNGEFQTFKQDSRLLVGAFHNANAALLTSSFGGTNDIKPAANATDPAIAKGAIPIDAQLNILNVGRIQALPAPQDAVPDPANPKGEPLVPALDANMAIVAPTAVTQTMAPNELITLTLQARNNVLGAASSAPLTAAQFAASETKPVLDGAIVYAQDAKNNRVGKFTTGGPSMQVWAACGNDQNGIVHNALLSESNTYSGPQFFLPWQFPLTNPGQQTITFMGAAVTDNGFGYHQSKFTVTPQQVAIDLMALNAQDVLKCATTSTPCFAACVDCAQKGGSTPKQATKTAKPTCTPNLAIGDPAKGQQTIWTASCKINNVVTPVAPAAAVVVPPPKKQDATTTPDEQNLWDQVTAAITLAANTTMLDPMDTNTNNNGQTSCPNNIANHAQSSSSTNLFTTLTVVLGALFASRQ